MDPAAAGFQWSVRQHMGRGNGSRVVRTGQADTEHEAQAFAELACATLAVELEEAKRGKAEPQAAVDEALDRMNRTA